MLHIDSHLVHLIFALCYIQLGICGRERVTGRFPGHRRNLGHRARRSKPDLGSWGTTAARGSAQAIVHPPCRPSMTARRMLREPHFPGSYLFGGCVDGRLVIKRSDGFGPFPSQLEVALHRGGGPEPATRRKGGDRPRDGRKHLCHPQAGEWTASQHLKSSSRQSPSHFRLLCPLVHWPCTVTFGWVDTAALSSHLTRFSPTAQRYVKITGGPSLYAERPPPAPYWSSHSPYCPITEVGAEHMLPRHAHRGVTVQKLR